MKCSARASGLNVVFVLAIAVTLLVPAFLSAQTNGIITGTVRDDDKREGIPFVNVLIKGTTLGDATDANGRYAIRTVPPGTYTLVASAVGFRTLEISVKVDAGETVTQNFVLAHSTVELGEVQVYGASLRRERITEAPAA
ncbi:MAG: carboxypeptidase-like regulatory domain-containing protein, partial [Bacteroidota bacterium]